MLEEPTRGVDVGSKREIYRLMREYASGGHAVIIFCTEVPEVFEAADLAYVVSDGRLSEPLVVTTFPDVEALARAVTRLERHGAVPAPGFVTDRRRPRRPGRLRQDQSGGPRAGADAAVAGGLRHRRALGGARRRGCGSRVEGAPDGLRCSTDLAATLRTTRPDVVVVATATQLVDVLPVLAAIAPSGVPIVCTAEDLAFIRPAIPTRRRGIIGLAETHRIPIVATGANPGFVLDLWPLDAVGLWRGTSSSCVRVASST